MLNGPGACASSVTKCPICISKSNREMREYESNTLQAMITRLSVDWNIITLVIIIFTPSNVFFFQLHMVYVKGFVEFKSL